MKSNDETETEDLARARAVSVPEVAKGDEKNNALRNAATTPIPKTQFGLTLEEVFERHTRGV